MKALVLKKPGELVIEERPAPVPQNDEVLLKVLQVGVCGTDLHAFQGNQLYFTYPRVMGHELAVQVAGIPASAKPAAKNFKEGDILTVIPYLRCDACVACRAGKTNCCVKLQCLGVPVDGGMQEYITIPAWHVIPAGKVSPQDLSIVECFSIGFHGVRRANPKRGEPALVVGAGPIGIGAIHGLKERGAQVIVLDINEKRLAYVKDVAKADHIINSAQTDPVQAVADLTGGEYVPVVMDATGNAQQMRNALNYACSGGSVTYVGLIKTDLAFPDGIFHGKELTLNASRNATKEDFENVIAGMESGRVSTKGFVTHTATMEEAVTQFASWIKPETGCIKAVIKIG
jgi:2-desacetyl-2-hydroxyethyl bacteriochlorophyllide A dehydrogenase